jgi:hypothetical protein
VRVKHYKILIRRNAEMLVAWYKTRNELEAGEELILFYEGKNNLVKINDGIKKNELTIEATEI